MNNIENGVKGIEEDITTLKDGLNYDLEYVVGKQNLITETQWNTGAYISASGVITPYATAKYTDLIPVTSDSFIYSYLASSSSFTTRIHGYDSNGDWVAQITTLSTGSTVEVKQINLIARGYSYIRISESTSIKPISLVTTNTVYGELKSEVDTLDLEYSALKSDLDSAIAFPNNLMDVANSTVGYELSNYATTASNQSYSVSEYIPIAEGQEYTFGLGTGDLGRISFYQTADTSQPICLSTSDWMSGKVPSAVASAVAWFTVNENNTMSFTVPSGYTDRQGRSIKYMRFTYWTSQADKAFCVKGTTLIDDVSFLGKVPYLDEEIDGIYEQIPSQDAVVDCLGDSHTGGVSTYTPYPSVLSELIGSSYSVLNFGAGGDGASDIVARQGALYAVCDPVTIADSQNYTNNVPLKLYSGDSLRQFGLKWIGINKDALTGNLYCLLGNVPVYVSFDNTNHFKVRPVSTGGGDIAITRPTKITTTYMQTGYKSHVLVLCMGSNDVSTVSIQKLADWNRLIAKQYQRYIIVGEPTVLNSTNREEYNALMYAYFGTHYIDINSYMIQYGLSDAGITPTAADEQAISQGITPPSLMYDSVHYNQSGIDVMATQIYKKGQDLGYWS